MSNLRDRLLSLSRQRTATPAQPAPQLPSCQMREASFPLPESVKALSSETLYALCGEEARSFCLQNALFMDTETTGLLGGAGTLAFLVGIGYVQGDRLIVRQYYMHDYDQEEDLLRRIAEHMKAAQSWVTYNGKTFDVPLLQSRFLLNRMRDQWKDFPNLDLLHAVRRTYKRRIGACNLGHVEEAVLGLERDGDIPGSEIPERWFTFIKTRDESLLEDILEHNLQDIVTLATLLGALHTAYAQPVQQPQQDMYSLARVFEKRGMHEEARRCYQALSEGGPEAHEAMKALFISLRKAHMECEALSILHSMMERYPSETFAYIENAKWQEHRCKNYHEALRMTDRALMFCRRGEETAALLKRRERLSRRIQREGMIAK